MPDAFDLIVIGAGPGGYVCAIRAAQLGLKVACVERQYLGGTCLNVGCIPSKALLESSHLLHTMQHRAARQGIVTQGVSLDLPAMMKRKDEVVKGLTTGVAMLLRKNKVEHVQGHGKLAGTGKVEVLTDGKVSRTLEAKNVVLATGSAPIQIGGLPFDGKYILSSTEALTLDKVPARLLIVGGGYIGVELGSVWSRLGADVTIVEFTDRILPASDAEMALALQKLLAKQGLKFQFSTAAEAARVEGSDVRVKLKQGETVSEVVVDRVIVAVGRRPYTDTLGLETVGIQTNKRGFVEVDEHFRAAPGVYAIGDVIGRIMLAHNAEEEGVAVAEILAGKHGHVNYPACPAVVYTHPELGSVGLTEAQARDKVGEIKVGKFPIVANGRARGMDETDGFVKVIGCAKTDRLLGVHVLAPHASDLIAEATLAIEFAASVEDLQRSYHAHPTLAECIKEAALAADGRVIHS